MAKRPIPTWTFVLALVKWGRRVLLVQEPGDEALWSIPGGRVEEGETLEQAVKREALEEAGMPIELEGLLRVERTLVAAGDARLRVIFLARPADDVTPKVVHDEHSRGARWFTKGEMAGLPMRSPDMHRLVRAAFEGQVAPLSLLGSELD